MMRRAYRDVLGCRVLYFRLAAPFSPGEERMRLQTQVLLSCDLSYRLTDSTTCDWKCESVVGYHGSLVFLDFQIRFEAVSPDLPK